VGRIDREAALASAELASSAEPWQAEGVPRGLDGFARVVFRDAIERSAVRLLLLALLWLPAVAAAAETPPPAERPVKVEVGFFLVNLSGVAERSETFDADIYLEFRWRDPRLAFAGTEPRRFLEEAATTHLEDIWWPQVELVNTAEPAITNRALTIQPDGDVAYILGLTSEFRTNLDLRRFPFDRQTLDIRVESFLWTTEDMVFTVDPKRIGFTPESTFEGLVPTRVGGVVRQSELAAWGEVFSEFVAEIEVERRANFYLWTVFAPVTLIFLISCSVFAVHYENIHDRVGISLAALLACIATQFAISFNLPQISYLTVIDRIFLATYGCIALGVLVSTIQATVLKHDPSRATRIDRLAGLGLPAVFFALIVLCVLW
jgi:hypothetical protein